MVRVRIFCHADLQALRKRSDQLLSVELVSLDSLRIASDSCKLLLNLIQGRDYPIEVNIAERRYWSCSQLVLLSLIAGVALELHKIKHDLYPLLVSPEANLEGGFLKDLLFLNNSALTLARLAKKATGIVQGLDQKVVIDGLLGRVKKFGQLVKDTADPVLKGTHNITWFQARLQSVLYPLDLLLLTPVQFPDPDKYASSDSDSDSDSD
ncbi:hypothetical protein VPH35_042470 [Triticum aestivum]